ncbi:PadR family transcriptional regulator [Acinetobacter gandensis]|uniref:PadR family transcriptional regulator n=1 Tax=Acinetobacter gandensis TaxID=1443941 RepID=A0A1A7RGA9_9GAMM|nr:PadR family transcriptional regulator [Acinetobacter gandensis]KAB0626139.1 PadR family transcriptional regulator [Acinetobacter gandensis]OBX29692.1 PadR family transcriptional regulator [Acinetobacter gandensis]
MPNSDIIADIESPVKTRKRLFEAGHMKILVLHLISQAPKFSYDIIKDVGTVVGGGYSPSTGTIYPTLNYLEEQQYIHAELNADERKQYSITALGTQHLAAQQSTIEKILCRFDTRKQIHNNEVYIDIKRAMENLKASLRLKILHSELSAEQVREIADKIDQAAVEISRMELTQ